MLAVRYDNPLKVSISESINVSGSTYTLKYPCTSSDCTPYAVTFKPGMYKIELWGASGGFLNDLGAHGSYTSGLLPIYRLQTLYIHLGQKGKWSGTATYNGGGAGTTGVTIPDNYVSGGSGGGASDIRLIKGPWDNFESLKSRISIAAGGAGHAYYRDIIEGGAGGALEGFNGSKIDYGPEDISISTGGTQTSGGIGTNFHGINGKFGIGGGGGDSNHGSGGGGGYYGGGSGGWASSRVTSGSGGSSYVSGFEGCKAIGRDSTPDAIYHMEISKHYSGMLFYNPDIKDGMSEIPCTNSSFDESCTEIGHFGNGFARITILEQQDPVTQIPCHPIISYSNIFVFLLFYSE